MRFSTRSAVAAFDHFRTNYAAELRRIETADANISAGFFADPVWYFGVHPTAPESIVGLVYVHPEGLTPMGAGAGQRLQRHITRVAVEIRMKGTQPIPTSRIPAQGEPGAFGENGFYKLYGYADALLGLVEPRSSDTGGQSFRPTLGNRVTVARVQRVSMEPETQASDHSLALGCTLHLGIQTTDEFVG